MNGLKEAILDETKRFEEFYHWLEKNMPDVFFTEVSREWINLIVHSLMGFKVQDYFSQIHLKNGAIALALESPDADVKILENYSLYGIKNYSTYVSKDVLPYLEIKAHLRIATIHFTEINEKEKVSLPDEKELLTALQKYNKEIDEKAADILLKKMDMKFLRLLPFERQVEALSLFYRAQTRDLIQYEVHFQEDWKEKNTSSLNILFAWKNTPKHNFLYRLARLVFNHNLVMQKVNAAYIDPYKPSGVLMLSFSLHGIKNDAAWQATKMVDFLKELATLKFFGSLDIFNETFVETKLLSGNEANLLRALRYFIHQVLVPLDPNLYSLMNIEEGLSRHPELTKKLIDAFNAKFDPESYDLANFEKIRSEFLKLVNAIDTGDEYQDTRRKNILLQGMNFIVYTLKTNFYKNNKSALAFRLDPLFLEKVPYDRKKVFPELPYAIFFIKGMHFFGFHIRFKDLSRGGLRTVFPDKREKMMSEINTVFQECYNLAYTQHKKNKDIPEGGAKGIIFLKPYERLENEAQILRREMQDSGYSVEETVPKIEEFKREEKLEYLYETQRSFISSFISLINCEPDGTLRAKHIVDYWKRPEYIYLGPDENMHDVMIEWIANFSKSVNYRPGGAFISGKPKLGINHKEYGVTSLGVTVFMHEALKYLNFDPESDVFTVKMTGGPDGDVGGNQLYNFYKYYKNTAKVVALTDISGTINDPNGLDLNECTKLFKEGKPIRFYPPEKLSEGGFLLDREKKKEINPYTFQTLLWRKKEGKLVQEWLSGNEMNALFRFNVHQTVADLFIPCGGRPRTLNDTNYKEFLDNTSSPTSKAIIEGANLYLTPWARHALEEYGVLIIKDSSANKGGVITSSFEIICGLTLTDEEFLENKQTLVEEILERVKECSKNEARLLLETHKKTKEFLTDISDEISKKINLYTDQLLEYLENITLSNDPKDPLIHTFLCYVPKTLRQKFEKRLLTAIPDNHKKAIIATRIASQLVYKRGLNWSPTVVDVLPLIIL